MLKKDNLIKLRSKKRYEEILGVREDASEEELNTAFLSSRKIYESDPEALLIITEAYDTLIDEKKRKELILWRWLKKTFSMWGEDARTQFIGIILRSPQIGNYSRSALQNFLRSDRAVDTILGILGIQPVEGPITKDEQREGCELQFKSVTGEILRVTVPPGVRDGEIVLVKNAIIKIRVIPRDAHTILDGFAYAFLSQFYEPLSRSGLSPILVKDNLIGMLNKESVIEYIRGRIKEGWSDERIINAMMSDITKQLPVSILRTSQKPTKQKEGHGKIIAFIIIIIIVILYYRGCLETQILMKTKAFIIYKPPIEYAE